MGISDHSGLWSVVNACEHEVYNVEFKTRVTAELLVVLMIARNLHCVSGSLKGLILESASSKSGWFTC